MYIPICETESPIRAVAIGELLWDNFPDSRRLGGAPLNFAVHLSRLGHRVILVSAVGTDTLGEEAESQVAQLGLEKSVLQIETEFPTGTANVEFRDTGEPEFTICRPAAYDALKLTERQLRHLKEWEPKWVYFGTLFSFTPPAKKTLQTFLAALPQAHRFCDLNLRPGCFTPEHVGDLLAEAHALKLNEKEMRTVSCLLDLPRSSMEGFCRAGSARFGWDAVAVTLGPRGSAVWIKGEYAEADGVAVQVSDTVGAGDAFSAAFLHGLDRGWQPCTIAAFANQVASLVASRPGAIPEWSLNELLTPRNEFGTQTGKLEKGA